MLTKMNESNFVERTIIGIILGVIIGLLAVIVDRLDILISLSI